MSAFAELSAPTSIGQKIDALVVQMHSSSVTYEEAMLAFKRRYVVEVLRRNRGNQLAAAKELGMHRNTLSRVIDDLEINVRGIRRGTKPVRSARPVSDFYVREAFPGRASE